jgi:hypothetical protein
MTAPLICIYCHKPIALHRDNYVLLPLEHPAGGDYRPAHLACVEAYPRDADAHPSAADREPRREPFETIYLTHHPRYRFALVIPRVVPNAVRRGLALFRLWRRGQTPQEGVVLTLPEIRSFHEDLGQVLEYLRHERNMRASRHPPPGEGEEHP